MASEPEREKLNHILKGNISRVRATPKSGANSKKEARCCVKITTNSTGCTPNSPASCPVPHSQHPTLPPEIFSVCTGAAQIQICKGRKLLGTKLIQYLRGPAAAPTRRLDSKNNNEIPVRPCAAEGLKMRAFAGILPMQSQAGFN